MRILIGLSLLLLVAAVYAGLEQNEARELVAKGDILPLTQILEKARKVQPGRILEVELEYEKEHGGYVYELEILDKKGQVWELEFNAVTGEVVELERED